MLIVKSKFKVAKRLGAAVFEKTQSQKFALSEARAKKPRGRGASDYGKQLLEKQRVRFTYGIAEGQLSNYAEVAFKEADPSLALHRALEMRADSLIYRAGFASTRRAGRQILSHGHILINGKRTTTPSYKVRVGDIVTVREGSRTSPLFASLTQPEETSVRPVPAWLAVDRALMKIEVTGEPLYNPIEAGLDYATVFEFYSR